MRAQRAGRDVLSILVRMHDEEGGLERRGAGRPGGRAVWRGPHDDGPFADLDAVAVGAASDGDAAVVGGIGQSACAAAMPKVASVPDAWRPTAAVADGSLPKGEELSLLDRVIKESMRLLPASAYSQRINTEPVQLGPFDLPRGTGIVFTPLVTHHLPDMYPQPERFLPDRWLTLRPSPYAYHPFGAGPRLCIGGPLATAIIRIALRRILSRFRLSVVPGSNVGVHVESTMLVPTNGAADANPRGGRQFREQPDWRATSTSWWTSTKRRLRGRRPLGSLASIGVAALAA